MRFIGLDVDRDFCEVAIAEGGEVRLAGRVLTEPVALALFAQSLSVEDEVALEATGNGFGIARIIEPQVGRVVLANPKAVKGITQAGAKADKIDARTLAKLLAGGFLPAVWLPDEQTRVLRRRISARAQLVRQRTRAKNQVHATLIRNLKGRPPVSDLFGARGRRWLAAQVLPADERETVAACLRQIEFLDGEIALVERALAEQVLASAQMRRLLTLPGVNFVTAAALIAAIGEISRFPTARQLVSYLGLDPRVRQSGSEPARHGRISKQGPGEARHVLVEAAWHATRTPGPLRALAERIASRRGANVAADRGRAQAGGDRLAHAQPRRGLRLRPPLAHAREAAPARADARRRAPPGEAQPGPRLRKQRAAPTRQGPRRPSRARLPAARPGLAARDQQGCGCRTGARNSSAVKRPSSAAGNSPTSCALARGHPRPHQLSQRSRDTSRT
jgi:transposase